MNHDAQHVEIIQALQALEEKVEILRQNSIYQQCQVNVYAAIIKTLFVMFLAQDTNPDSHETIVKNIFEVIRVNVERITYTGVSEELANYISAETKVILENQLLSILGELDALKAVKSEHAAMQNKTNIF